MSAFRRALTQFARTAPAASPSAASSGLVGRRLASNEVSKSHDHSHGPPPYGAESRPEALAYPSQDSKKAVAHTHDGGDIDWAGVTMPTNSKGLFGPGSLPGTQPSDFEQATGRERYELLHRMAGLDPWHIGELQVPYHGTMKNPIFIWSSNPFRIVGCTGHPKDSHDRKYMRVRMGPIATRCTECGIAYALDYVGPFRNELGQLLSLAPGSTPEDPKFVVDAELNAHDAFAHDVELDFAPQREGRFGAEHRRWDGWYRGETPENWELLHADDATRQQALTVKTDDSRPLAWWDYAKGTEWAQKASEDKPKTFWGSHLQAHSHDHH